MSYSIVIPVEWGVFLSWTQNLWQNLPRGVLLDSYYNYVWLWMTKESYVKLNQLHVTWECICFQHSFICFFLCFLGPHLNRIQHVSSKYQSFHGIFNFPILQKDPAWHSAFGRRQAGSKEWDHLTRSTRGRVEGLQTALRTKLTSSQDQADGWDRWIDFLVVWSSKMFKGI